MAVDTPFVMVILPGPTGTSGKGKGGGAPRRTPAGLFCRLVSRKHYFNGSPVNNIFHRQWLPGPQGQALYPPLFSAAVRKLFDNQEVVQ